MSIESDMRFFGARRYFEADKAVQAIRVKDIGIDILMAIGTRESNLMNILNPAGTDRGVWQITDIYHSEWLARYPGCLSGQWTPTLGKTAVDSGCVPTVKDGAHMGYTILSNALFEARRNKVAQPVRFAVAAYNGGIGGALKGLREGDVDKYTTGHNYSRDVMDVRWPLIKEIVSDFGWF